MNDSFPPPTHARKALLYRRAAFLCAVTLTLLLASATLSAAPPAINRISPTGLRRGETTVLTLSGGNLTGQIRLVAPFALSQEAVPADKADPARWQVKVLVDPRTTPGIYPVRVRTDDGVSDPRLLVVGALPQAEETEDNNRPGGAQTLALPVTVGGQAAGGDVDYFRFEGEAGQRIVAEVEASRIGSDVDPAVEILTAGGRQLALGDDTAGLHLDCRAVAVLPSDGTYFVKLYDARFRGGGNAVYRLNVGPLHWVQEVFPLGGRRGGDVTVRLRGGSLREELPTVLSLEAAAYAMRQRLPLDVLGAFPQLSGWLAIGEHPEVFERDHRTGASGSAQPEDSTSDGAVFPKEQAQRVAWPVTVNGRIDRPGDVDRFSLAVKSGQRLRFEVAASALGSQLDGYLTLYDPGGKQLAVADDTAGPPAAPGLGGQTAPDPSLDFTVPAGVEELVAALRDLHDRGGVGYAYRLTIEAAEPAFDLRVAVPTMNIPRGGSVGLTVALQRRGYNGPVQLGVEGLPAGFTVDGGHIPEGRNEGLLTVTAPAETLSELFDLTVYGEGQRGDGALRRRAVSTIVYARDATFAVSMWDFTKLAGAVALPPPLTLRVPTQVQLVHGYSVTVPVDVIRPAGEAETVALSVAGLPAGVTAAAVNLEANKSNAEITLTAAAAAGEPIRQPVVTNGAVREMAAPQPAAPLGKLSVLVQGKVGDRTVVAPGVTLELLRPFAVRLEGTGAVTVAADASVKIAGHVVRYGPFKEPVDVRLEGLPEGITAAPVRVAAGEDRFEMELRAAAERQAGTFDTARLFATAKISEKPYTPPPLPLTIRAGAEN